MKNKPTILSVDPPLAIPGGEISLSCQIEVFEPDYIECLFDDMPGALSAASGNRILVRVPDGFDAEDVEVKIRAGETESEPFGIKVGVALCSGMHIVANPAVDPEDGSIVLTRSGTRGQELPSTLFRVRNGKAEPMEAHVMNPTGVAFDSRGRLYVTNRADGEVCQVNNDKEVVQLATELGVATGIAFSKENTMFVGDRSGNIYRVSSLGDARVWANLEPSVSAYHMAFAANGDLFVAAPGLSSHDSIYRIGPEGNAGIFYKGLGRPQGIAFDDKGNLYAAACLKGRHGLVRIDEKGENAALFVAGMGVVGLCFDRDGGLLVATADSLYRFQTGISGTMLA